MSNHTNPEPFTQTMGTDETSVVLKVSPETVCDYIRRDWLKATRVGRRWLIDRNSVQRLLENGTPPHSP